MLPEDTDTSLGGHVTHAQHTIGVGDRVGYRQDRGGRVITGTVEQIIGAGTWTYSTGHMCDSTGFAWIEWDNAMPLAGCWMEVAQLRSIDEG